MVRSDFVFIIQSVSEELFINSSSILLNENLKFAIILRNSLPYHTMLPNCHTKIKMPQVHFIIKNIFDRK